MHPTKSHSSSHLKLTQIPSQLLEGQTVPRRLWVWPLRTGLMTVLTLGGLLLSFSAGCGGNVGPDQLAASGGNHETTSNGSAGHSGGAITEAPSTTTGGGSSLGQGGRSSATTADPTECASNGDAVGGLFADQVFSSAGPRPNVLYTWTTTQQAQELRNGGPLFSRSERPDLGRGNALDALARLATGSSSMAQLASLLSQEVFATARYAWTNPWATRMGWPDEQYGNQLIRIELKDAAWHASFDGQNLSVSDSAGVYIPIEEVLANPSRVAAILYWRGPSEGGPRCGTFGQYLDAGTGTGAGTTSGYREIVLGNVSMVKRWSLGSEEIATRVKQDIETLRRFLAVLQKCPPIAYDPDWNGMVSCSWNGPLRGSPTDYVDALAIPNDYYQPSIENVRRIIDTLESDGFETDPYVVDME